MARLSNSIGVLLVAITLASAKTINIKVIDDVFEPNTTTAAKGDMLRFEFQPHNHSVVMGDFADACQPAKTGGFYSGFLPVNDGEASKFFEVAVNDTKPFVYYCSQGRRGGGHCQIGMVGIVNADPGALQRYADAARTVELANSPPAPFGGQMVSGDAPSSTTSGAPTETTGQPTTVPSTAAANMAKASLGSGILAGIFVILMA